MQILFPLIFLIATTHGFPWETISQLFAVDNNDCTVMNNIGYVLSGYDIYSGNPVSTDELVDPGFREHIFTAKYNGGLSEDGRFCAPDGIQIESCRGSCNYDFSTSVMSGLERYTENLEIKASISFGLFGGEFGASSDYKHYEEETSSYTNIITEAETACCAYVTKVYDYTAPEFHPNFLGGLQSLPEDYDEHVYIRFVENFGTHYVKEANMGALYGELSLMSRETYSKLVTDSIDIELWVKASALASLSLNNSNMWNQTAASEFSKYTAERKVYSKGKVPPTSGDPFDWMTDTLEDPMPMTFKMRPIDELPKIDEFVSPKVKANIKTAISSYCEFLHSSGKLTSCDINPPDPPLPKPRIWTHWSNDDLSGRDYPVQQCQEGEFIDVMIWRYAGGLKGLGDLMFRCSDKSWSGDATEDTSGDWDDPMVCKNGFKQLTGRYTQKSGIINMRAFCKGSELEMTSNDDMAGSYDQDMDCKDGKQAVGVQLRHYGVYGIVNLKILCA